MKTFRFTLLFLILMVSVALGQTESKPSGINSDPTFTTPFATLVRTPSLSGPGILVDLEQDIYFNGVVKITAATDTSLAAGFRLYGYIWRTRHSTGFPKYHISGKDSAAVQAYWRKVVLGPSSVLAVGPWITCGSAVTFAAPLANRDTLFQVAAAASDSTAYSSGLVNGIQFSLVVVDGSAAVPGGNKPLDMKSNAFYTWAGRTFVTWTRDLLSLF